MDHVKRLDWVPHVCIMAPPIGISQMKLYFTFMMIIIFFYQFTNDTVMQIQLDIFLGDTSQTQTYTDHIRTTAQCVTACELPTRPRFDLFWTRTFFSCLPSFILLSSDNVSQRTRPCLFYLWRVHLSLCPSLLPCPLTQSGLVSSLH